VRCVPGPLLLRRICSSPSPLILLSAAWIRRPPAFGTTARRARRRGATASEPTSSTCGGHLRHPLPPSRICTYGRRAPRCSVGYRHPSHMTCQPQLARGRHQQIMWSALRASSRPSPSRSSSQRASRRTDDPSFQPPLPDPGHGALPRGRPLHFAAGVLAPSCSYAGPASTHRPSFICSLASGATPVAGSIVTHRAASSEPIAMIERTPSPGPRQRTDRVRQARYANRQQSRGDDCGGWPEEGLLPRRHTGDSCPASLPNSARCGSYFGCARGTFPRCGCTSASGSEPRALTRNRAPSSVKHISPTSLWSGDPTHQAKPRVRRWISWRCWFVHRRCKRHDANCVRGLVLLRSAAPWGNCRRSPHGAHRLVQAPSASA
jgi:hypothetical protein